MRFPDSERVRYEKDTLVEVICQLRFPQILSIGTKPPDEFQDEVRDQYPSYRKDDSLVAPPELAALFSQLPVAPPPEATTHYFEDADGRRSISLGANFVAVTAQVYPGWDDFREQIQFAVSALEKVYRPPFYERIGLRYRDSINRVQLDLAETPWAELLDPAMVTLMGADLAIEPGKDQIRADALLHLDDPAGSKVRLQHGLGPDGPDTYFIDSDFFIEERKELDAVLGILDKFRLEEGNLFRWAIQPALRDALGVADGNG